MNTAAITAILLALVSLSTAESNVQCRFNAGLIAVWEYVQNQMSGGTRAFRAIMLLTRVRNCVTGKMETTIALIWFRGNH